MLLLRYDEKNSTQIIQTMGASYVCAQRHIAYASLNTANLGSLVRLSLSIPTSLFWPIGLFLYLYAGDYHDSVAFLRPEHPVKSKEFVRTGLMLGKKN